ncbi:MAG: hypothetical protein HYY06_02865 [Deltaproteobacteria bacterium]|nr:hypothetical protein [Deltaproteobacteria bacterium]
MCRVAMFGALLIWGCEASPVAPSVRVLATEPEDRIVDAATTEIGLLFVGTRDGTVAAALGDPDSMGALTEPVEYRAGSLGSISVRREGLPTGGHLLAVALTPDGDGDVVLDEVAFTVDVVDGDDETPACLGQCASDGDCGSCPVPSTCLSFDEGERRCFPSID